MAITPRTILTSAAPATVAVVSLYFFTVLGTAAFTCLTDADESAGEAPDDASAATVLERSDACDHVANRFGDDKSAWSEFAWVNYGYCFDDRDESQLAIEVARQGLEHHPDSEILYNLKGYHQIVLGKHAEAIDTLEEGMTSVSHHRNGVMANNLAWAGLWEPRKMNPEDARELYVKSLALSPGVCETVHTGLFVEFAIADQADGIDQFEPRKRFSQLRNRYNRCLDRLADGDRKTVAEVLGAAVLFDDFDNTSANEVHPLMSSATAKYAKHHSDVSIDTICEEAMPLADYHHQCVDAVETSLEASKERAQRHEVRDRRVDEVRRQFMKQRVDDSNVVRQHHKRVEVEGGSISGSIQIRTGSSSGCGGM